MTTKARLPVALILSLFGAACTRSGDAPKAEPVALNVTHWTEKTELYMEYPPLVAGQSARFAVHLDETERLPGAGRWHALAGIHAGARGHANSAARDATFSPRRVSS